MNYLIARNAFLKSCGNPTGEERDRVIQMFDLTLIAAQARFADAWAELFDNLFPWRKI